MGPTEGLPTSIGKKACILCENLFGFNSDYAFLDIIWGCGCGFHVGGVAATKSYPKELVQRCDVGELQQSSVLGYEHSYVMRCVPNNGGASNILLMLGLSSRCQWFFDFYVQLEYLYSLVFLFCFVCSLCNKILFTLKSPLAQATVSKSSCVSN